MTNPYGRVLVDHFRHPRNRGTLESPSVSEEGVNSLCGDRVRIELRLERGIVTAARFSANACALCVASASVLTELATGAPLDEVDTLTIEDLLRSLGTEVPEARRNCIRLPLTVLHAGVMLHRRANRLPSVDRSRPVAAVVLAAGRARRFGAQKLLAPFGASTVVRTVVDTVRAAGVDYVVVVGGPGGDAVRASVGGAPVTWAENADPDRGLASSVTTGLGALPPNVGAALMVLGDQPTVSVQVVTQLVAAWRAGGGPVVAPRYRGLRGNPVLFDSTVFDALAALEGDHGARDFIAADPARVTMVDMSEPPPMDIDTPSDYDELLRRGRPGPPGAR
jgi:CTP:molybdopterin cytidylyltransferase MocA/NifU-like protein involved in Fe-S cluster formation